MPTRKCQFMISQTFSSMTTIWALCLCKRTIWEWCLIEPGEVLFVELNLISYPPSYLCVVMQLVAYSCSFSLISVSSPNLRVPVKVTMPCFLLLSMVVFMNDMFLCESDITKKHTYCWKLQLSSSNWCGSDFHLLATETLEKFHTYYITSHKYDRCTLSWCNWWMFGLCEIICVCIWMCLMMDLIWNTWRNMKCSLYCCQYTGECAILWEHVS